MKKLSALFTKYRKQLTEQFGSTYFHDPFSLFLIGLISLSLLAIFLLLIFRVNGTFTSIPVTYDVIYGVTSSGSFFVLYEYLLAAAAFCLVNTLLAWILFEKERILSYLLGVISFVIEIIFFIYIYNLTALIR